VVTNDGDVSTLGEIISCDLEDERFGLADHDCSRAGRHLNGSNDGPGRRERSFLGGETASRPVAYKAAPARTALVAATSSA
jgi:hypothetical protein